MNLKFFTVALSMSILMGSAYGALRDVGVVGPSGNVILFYRSGDNIIVKNCDANTVLGLTTAEARKNCVGKANKVSVESFKEAIRHRVSKASFRALRFLTAEEIDKYNSYGLSLEQVEEIEKELNKINAFITAYGAENADLIRKDYLVEELLSSKTRVSALRKINAEFKRIDREIENTLDLITDDTKLTLPKVSTDKDKFLYPVLQGITADSALPCGLKGSLDERIKDCSSQLNSQKEGFILVTRNQNLKEVHQEISTGLLWGDHLGEELGMYEAKKACQDYQNKMRFDDEMKISWRLPSLDEYTKAIKNGMRKAKSYTIAQFWTSVSTVNGIGYSYLMDDSGHSEFVDIMRVEFHSARCVAKP